jgi:hypothetical protein
MEKIKREVITIIIILIIITTDRMKIKVGGERIVRKRDKK